MSSKKITELREAVSITGSELIPLVQAGETKKATLNTITSSLLQGPKGDPGISLNWTGEWASGAIYLRNDIVYYQGNSFICVNQHSNVTPAPNFYWNIIAEKGTDGINGTNGINGVDGTDGETFNWQSQWVSGNTYADNDVVQYEGSSYIASGTILPGNIPGVYAGWDLLAAKGEEVPSGGLTNQYLKKNSNSNYDFAWETLKVSGPVYIATDDYLATVDDNFVIVNRLTGAPTTITLPNSPVVGQTFIVKDGKGDAATNNITVDGNGNNIDGSIDYVINVNYGSLSLVYNGTQWNNWSLPPRPVIAIVA
jgi:hypothetical protein